MYRMSEDVSRDVDHSASALSEIVAKNEKPKGVFFCDEGDIAAFVAHVLLVNNGCTSGWVEFRMFSRRLPR